MANKVVFSRGPVMRPSGNQPPRPVPTEPPNPMRAGTYQLRASQTFWVRGLGRFEQPRPITVPVSLEVLPQQTPGLQQIRVSVAGNTFELSLRGKQVDGYGHVTWLPSEPLPTWLKSLRISHEPIPGNRGIQSQLTITWEQLQQVPGRPPKRDGTDRREHVTLRAALPFPL